MQIQICRLTPELAEEYVRFFDETPHNQGADENKCYCITWRSDDSYAKDNNSWFSSPKERRTKALQYVGDGSLQGYLAYWGDEIVGWCNANANCESCIHYLRTYWPIPEPSNKLKIKSIFCFMVAPKMQRKGVATKLIERVCQDAAQEGFDFVEAYTCKQTTATNDYNGPFSLYQKCGFTVQAEKEDKIVVRKALK
ncbi:MAG: GNAT family N-acetyltransferase [Clostridiales bacterium]|nr:GNAT family N-acetyltransferase [Clostridiales bacterium]